jgi:hypothetical protein
MNTISTMSLGIFTLSSWSYARELTLCMLAFWSHEGVIFLDFLSSPHLVTYFRLSCLGSTDPHCPRLGAGPSPSKMAPLFTGSAHTSLPGFGTQIPWGVVMWNWDFPVSVVSPHVSIKFCLWPSAVTQWCHWHHWVMTWRSHGHCLVTADATESSFQTSKDYHFVKRHN